MDGCLLKKKKNGEEVKSKLKFSCSAERSGFLSFSSHYKYVLICISGFFAVE